MTANMLYTLRNYSAALIELEQANALMPDHYGVLHLRGMCKAELEQYEDAISDPLLQCPVLKGHVPLEPGQSWARV